MEAAFDRGLRAHFPRAYVINQPDFPWASVRPALKSGGKTKFVAKQHPDRIVISKRYGAWCFELKACAGRRFAFSRLKPHQERRLRQFRTLAGRAYLLVSFNRLARAFAVPVEEYVRARAASSRKSLTLEDVERMAAANGGVVEVPVEVPDKLPRLVLSALLARPLTEFLRKS